MKAPHTPFSTPLSGSAKETELRIRSIFQWKKKRPPVVLIVLALLVAALCGSLVSCQEQAEEPPVQDPTPYPVQAGDPSAVQPDADRGVTLKLDGQNYSNDGPTVSYTLENHSGTTLYFGPSTVSMEVLQNGVWHKLAIRTDIENLATNAIGYYANDGETFQAKQSFFAHGDLVPDGVYRLVIGLSTDTPPSEEFYVAAEFTVGEDTSAPPVSDTPAADSDPQAVVDAMKSVRAEDFTNPEYFGNVTPEALAAALNDAAERQITEEAFLAACGQGAVGATFPHWYIEDAWLEGGSGGHSSDDLHFSIRCGLPENIVEVALIGRGSYLTAYFEDETLYRMIRHKNDTEEVIDQQAYEQFEHLLTAEMESAFADLSTNPGNFTGYQLTHLFPIWDHEDSGTRTMLYRFDYVLLTDTPETVGWAGGMCLDSQLRVGGVGRASYIAAQYQGETLLRATLLGWDFPYAPPDPEQTDEAMIQINAALDRVERTFTLTLADGQVVTVLAKGTRNTGSGNDRAIRVEQLHIYGSMAQVIHASSLTYDGEYLFDGLYLISDGGYADVDVRDFNFDGSQDFALMTTAGFPHNIPYAYFLWDDAARQFTFSFVLANPLTVDAEHQQLIEWVHVGGTSPNRNNYYEFTADGQLTLIKSEDAP